MILLDTNVLSELMRPIPDPKVERWVAVQPAGDLFMTSISEAELRYGVGLMPAGKRRAAIAARLDLVFAEDFANRILAFDSQAATEFADIAAKRRQA